MHFINIKNIFIILLFKEPFTNQINFRDLNRQKDCKKHLYLRFGERLSDAI